MLSDLTGKWYLATSGPHKGKMIEVIGRDEALSGNNNWVLRVEGRTWGANGIGVRAAIREHEFRVEMLRSEEARLAGLLEFIAREGSLMRTATRRERLEEVRAELAVLERSSVAA